MQSRETKQLFALSALILSVSLMLDIFGFEDSCLSLQCVGGSWFWGSVITYFFYVFPGVVLYFFLPEALKIKWFVIPLSFFMFLTWVITQAILTDGEPFRHSIISLLGLILFFRLCLSKKG